MCVFTIFKFKVQHLSSKSQHAILLPIRHYRSHGDLIRLFKRNSFIFVVKVLHLKKLMCHTLRICDILILVSVDKKPCSTKKNGRRIQKNIMETPIKHILRSNVVKYSSFVHATKTCLQQEF